MGLTTCSLAFLNTFTSSFLIGRLVSMTSSRFHICVGPLVLVLCFRTEARSWGPCSRQVICFILPHSLPVLVGRVASTLFQERFQQYVSFFFRSIARWTQTCHLDPVYSILAEL